jgi:hypothetical protein
MLTPIHRDTVASCPVLAQGHTNDARSILTACSYLDQSPSVILLSDTTATADPPLTPSRGEGHPLA